MIGLKGLFPNILTQKPNGRHSIQGPFHKVFTCEGETFFAYDSLGDISVNRAEQIETVIEVEAEFNINRGDLAIVLADVRELLSPDNGVSEVGKAMQILEEVHKRLIMLPRQETIYKIAAILFFTAKGDPGEKLALSEIDRRADIFKKKGVLSEILKTPLKNIFNLEGQSNENSLTSLVKRMRIEAVIYKYQDTLLGLSPGNGDTLEK